MLKQFLITVIFFGFTVIAVAQTPDTVKRDTTGIKKDAVVINKDTSVIKNVTDTIPQRSFAPKIKKEKEYHPDSTHIPSLAVKRSLFIPGWGQVYNHKIWKVPIIYGGLVSLGLAVVYNQKNYTEFLALARIVKRGNTTPPAEGERYYAEYIKYKADYERYSGVGYQALADASDGFLRNRSLSILGIIGLWGIQAIDAYIDAKFINSYTVDDNLSFRVTPGLIGQPVYASNFNSSFIPGIKITFTL